MLPSGNSQTKLAALVEVFVKYTLVTQDPLTICELKFATGANPIEFTRTFLVKVSEHPAPSDDISFTT